jgi:hypothetical protein
MHHRTPGLHTQPSASRGPSLGPRQIASPTASSLTPQAFTPKRSSACQPQCRRRPCRHLGHGLRNRLLHTFRSVIRACAEFPSGEFGPRPATSLRAARVRSGPLTSRSDTVLAATAFPSPNTRASSGADAVFTSTPRVHRVLDHGRQGAGQLVLADVVLVLVDADRLRVDLHELGQPILQPAGDREGAPVRDVEPGQFAAGDLGGRVDRGAGLGKRDFHHFQLGVRGNDLGGQLAGLARGRAVADGDELDPVQAAQAAEGRHRLLPAALRHVR